MMAAVCVVCGKGTDFVHATQMIAGLQRVNMANVRVSLLGCFFSVDCRIPWKRVTPEKLLY